MVAALAGVVHDRQAASGHEQHQYDNQQGSLHIRPPLSATAPHVPVRPITRVGLGSPLGRGQQSFFGRRSLASAGAADDEAESHYTFRLSGTGTTQVSSRAKEYKARAAECVRLCQETNDLALKAMFLVMAQRAAATLSDFEARLVAYGRYHDLIGSGDGAALPISASAVSVRG